MLGSENVHASKISFERNSFITTTYTHAYDRCYGLLRIPIPIVCLCAFAIQVPNVPKSVG